MNAFRVALWAELLKARHALVAPLTTLGFLILPLVGGLFMLILKNPARAQALGLISVKAQLTAGVADWPTFLQMLAQGVGIGGAILFALITAWVFGREFSDHTVKELLALPTPRGAIVGAKFALLALWLLSLTVLVFVVGLGIGAAVNIPGWSPALIWSALTTVLTVALLTGLLMPWVALVASVGRGYLAPMGWAVLTLVLAQVVSVLGWGDWFPWAVPVLLSGMAGPSAARMGLHGYLVVILVGIAGGAATTLWWRSADQAR
ncbi:MAG: ABC transporter permease subunit [Chloroflexales bacterium]|nr:ABC transporter permease subunit [Chloroflexales bacterium]